jgi:NitT/TauT family transport system substrate-binding protein
MNIRSRLVLALGYCAAVVAQTPALSPLRIAGNMTTLELAPVLVAANGLYRGQVIVINGGIPELMRGEVDAATNAETQLLRRSVEDPSLRIIFTEAESFYRVVARRSAGIKSAADLRGKKVAVAPNTSAHYYLFRLLETAGISEDAVTAVPVTPRKMSEMLANREVDAVAIWEPESANAVAALRADALVLQNRSLYRELFGLQTTTKVLANPDKRRAMVEFLRSLISASAGLRDRPREFWPVISSRENYSEEVISRSWPQLRYAGSVADDLLDVMVREERWVANETARTPRTREQLGVFIDRSLLEEARSETGK